MTADNPPSVKALSRDTGALLVSVGVVMMVAATLFGLAAIWWWALAGMSGPVGAACTATGVAVALFGGFLIVLGVLGVEAADPG